MSETYVSASKAKKLSVIIPTAGNHPVRLTNLRETLKCLQTQTYPNWELVIVEQSIDGNFYHKGLPADIYLPLKDPQNRGFNISWIRNVGARIATGEVIIILDADHVFDPEFLDKIAHFQGDPFFSCAEFFVWTTQRQKLEYLKSGDLTRILSAKNGFRPLNGKVGWACIIGFNRDWYITEFVGYIENFFKYGWEDVEGVHRIAKILNKKITELHKVQGVRVAHLFHGDRRSNQINKKLNNMYIQQDAKLILDQLRSAKVGQKESPKLIQEFIKV